MAPIVPLIARIIAREKSGLSTEVEQFTADRQEQISSRNLSQSNSLCQCEARSHKS
jgi:hypothetical protein